MRTFNTLAALALVLAGAAAPHRPRADGSIAGRVVDRSKHVFPQATVTARAYTGGPLKEMLSRADGTYEFAALPDGLYQVDASVPGFDMARLNRVEVRGQAVQAADLPLDVSAICECIGVGWRGAQVVLQGVISDERGVPLPHVRLTLSSGGVEARGYADAAGRFEARVGENNEYVLTATTTGFATERTTIRVREAARGPMTVPINLAGEALPVALPPVERLQQPCCEQGVFVRGRP